MNLHISRPKPREHRYNILKWVEEVRDDDADSRKSYPGSGEAGGLNDIYLRVRSLSESLSLGVEEITERREGPCAPILRTVAPTKNGDGNRVLA
jgi:hypothetical protein